MIYVTQRGGKGRRQGLGCTVAVGAVHEDSRATLTRGNRERDKGCALGKKFQPTRHRVGIAANRVDSPRAQQTGERNLRANAITIRPRVADHDYASSLAGPQKGGENFAKMRIQQCHEISGSDFRRRRGDWRDRFGLRRDLVEQAEDAVATLGDVIEVVG